MSLALLNLGCGRRRHPAWTNTDLHPETPEVITVDVRAPLPFDAAEFDAAYASHVLEHLAPDAGERLVREMFRVLKPRGVIRVVVPDLEGICRSYLGELERAACGEPEAIERHVWMTVELIDQMTRTRPGGLMLRWWFQEHVPAEAFVIERLGRESESTIAEFRQRVADGSRTPIPPGRWTDVPEPSDDQLLAFRRTGEAHRWMYDRVSLGRLLGVAGFVDIAVRSAQESLVPGWTEYGLDADESGRAHKPDSLYLEAVRPAE
ncbi:MAG: methyltransferase domain-containing protein [Phycisphaerae bacterium]|nr:methyltransferase domain-containing protein [Phycisphaerae bacterium]